MAKIIKGKMADKYLLDADKAITKRVTMILGEIKTSTEYGQGYGPDDNFWDLTNELAKDMAKEVEDLGLLTDDLPESSVTYYCLTGHADVDMGHGINIIYPMDFVLTVRVQQLDGTNKVFSYKGLQGEMEPLETCMYRRLG